MENFIEGYRCTYDDRNDYSCGRNRCNGIQYNRTYRRYPNTHEEKIDIKKAALLWPVQLLLGCFLKK